ncbi:MAG: heavy metal-binding domain-containing protein [Bacteroidota bacterium]|nr:heavy metal-binding domain-containing protein [Bacteroidota bacterium]MDP4230905.1 heavy metal-binding domain-containing protein [Bacteroidota bacterium]MDP4235977.1 heavy metal-binding domain-containing protein [Bacteroidota bacterium]
MKNLALLILFATLFLGQSVSSRVHHSSFLPSPDSMVNGSIYHAKAVVKKKLRADKKIIIKHERIKGLMEAMTMAFPVADSTIFDSCAIGSKGLFTFQIVGGYPVITAAHFDKLPQYVCPMHPDELSNKPGSCSQCGMPLEKRKWN